MILLTTKCLSMVSCDISLHFPPFYITRFSFLYSRCSSVAMIYFQTDLFTIGNLVEVLSVWKIESECECAFFPPAPVRYSIQNFQAFCY